MRPRGQRTAALLLLPLMLPIGAEGAKPPSPTIEALAFLAGSWKGKVGGKPFSAYYSTPEGGKVLSYSVLTKGTVSFHEFELFEARRGHLILTPYPGGKPRPEFRATEVAPGRAVFDNPKKDFPTRIEYRSEGRTLRITLSDPHGGQDRTVVYLLERSHTP